MKKITIALVAVISAILMCVGLVACGASDVAGNTYVFDSVTVKFDSSVSEEDKEEANEDAEQTKAMYEQGGFEITFNSDGTYTQKMGEYEDSGYYVQDGDKLYIYDTKEEADEGDTSKATLFKVDGKKIVIEDSGDGITMVLTFKKK